MVLPPTTEFTSLLKASVMVPLDYLKLAARETGFTQMT